jgi:hypothetical protein
VRSDNDNVLCLGESDRDWLVFGGPYSNLQATQAMRAEAEALGIPPERTICTGDVVAYCADAAATVALVRAWGVHVVMGNCEESLGYEAGDCGCGFAEGSDCEVAARQWFVHAASQLDVDARAWMAGLPRMIRLRLARRDLAVIHGGVRQINRFIFASAADVDLLAELASAGAEAVIGGHCGIPFTRQVGARLWHNAGVIGMPANDGTPRGWYSLLRPAAGGIRIELRAFAYDHAGAAAAMRAASLNEGYAGALSSGRWPSLDILPEPERAATGRPLAETAHLWPEPVQLAAAGD